MATKTYEDKELGVKVVVCKNREWDEWQARVYIDGKFDEGPTSYHGDDKQDAIDTGKETFDDLCRWKLNKELDEAICDVEELLTKDMEKEMDKPKIDPHWEKQIKMMDGDWFDAKLAKLYCCKADLGNRRKLAIAFPKLAETAEVMGW